MVVQQPRHLLTQCLGFLVRDGEAGLAVAHQVGQAAHFGGNHRRSAGHRFEGYHAERFIVGRHHQQLGCRIIIGQPVLVTLAKEDDRLLHREIVTQLLQTRHLGAHLARAGRRIPADDGQMYPLTFLQLQAGHGLDQRVHALERLDPPDEQHHTVVGLQPHVQLGFVGRDGIEVADVHAGRDGDQLVRRGLI